MVFRSGAVPMPVFTLGCTSETDYQHQLDTLTSSPYVELHAPHTIMTLTRDGALLYRGEDHAALLELVETIIDSHARISGLDGTKPVHRRKAGPYHFTEVSKVPTGVGAYATHGYNGFPAPTSTAPPQWKGCAPAAGGCTTNSVTSTSRWRTSRAV